MIRVTVIIRQLSEYSLYIVLGSVLGFGFGFGFGFGLGLDF